MKTTGIPVTYVEYHRTLSQLPYSPRYSPHLTLHLENHSIEAHPLSHVSLEYIDRI